MIFVDSDNALGSPRGDVDDGLALAVLLCSSAPVEALASTFGNTSSERAHRNNQRLAELCGFARPCLPGAPQPGELRNLAAEFLAHESRADTLLALGPLTNVARALDLSTGLSASVSRLICLGSNPSSFGRWPPVWPFEFNFTKDAGALVRVFESSLPITVVPLDRACRMRVSFADLGVIRGSLGNYVRRHAERWFVRARRLKLQGTVPVWDLVAVGVVLWPELFRFEELSARAHPSGWIRYGDGDRRVQVVREFSPKLLWERSIRLLNAAQVSSAGPANDSCDRLNRTG